MLMCALIESTRGNEYLIQTWFVFTLHVYVCGKCTAKEDHFYIACKLSHDCTYQLTISRSYALNYLSIAFCFMCVVEAREFNREAALTGTQFYHTEKKEDYLLSDTLRENFQHSHILCTAPHTFEGIILIIRPAIKYLPSLNIQL